MTSRTDITRRRFIKAAGVLPATIRLLAGLATGEQIRSRVVIVRKTGVMPMGTNKPDADILGRMVDRCVCILTREKDRAKAWGKVASPSDVVGVKVNAIAGPNMSTHPELAAAIAKGLASAGVPESSVVIWDRQDRELERAGFDINTSEDGFRCYGTDNPAGGYAARGVSVSGNKMKLSSILAQQTTLLINAPVVKDHGIAGVTCAMKNHYGSVNRPGALHGGNCNPHIANLNALAPIRKKTRLVICDALRCLYDGGPGFNEKHIWHEEAVIASSDPVALDRVVADLIESQRAKRGMKSLAQSGRPWTYIQTAGRMGLGESDLSKIEVIEETLS